MSPRFSVSACHYETRRVIRVVVEGGRITAVEPTEEETDLWIAPGFRDLQFNGGGGVSFSDPGLTVEQVRRVVLAQPDHGSIRVFPTLITASREATLHGLMILSTACEADDEVSGLVGGIHLEGPYISGRDGYRGATPPGTSVTRIMRSSRRGSRHPEGSES